MRTTRADFDRAENQESSQGYAYGLQGGASVGTPWLSEEGMGEEEVPSLSICLSIYLSTNNKQWAPLENKMRDIFIKKCFIHSFKFINHVMIMAIQHDNV